MELELWRKGQLQADDDDDEKEDPNALPTDVDLGKNFSVYLSYHADDIDVMFVIVYAHKLLSISV